MSRTSTPPPNSVRRLFVRLNGVVSLKGIHVLVTWAPTADESEAYHPTGQQAPVASNCTWLMRGQPITLANQTDSTLQILTSGSVNSSCSSGNVLVINFPQYSPGQTPPGRIVLAYAVTLDANNDEDLLVVSSPATIKGGTMEPAPIASALSPQGGWVGSSTEYEIDGLQFHPSMTIRLAQGSDTLNAAEKVVLDSRRARATFSYLDGHQGWWNLILTNPGGRWTGDVNSLKVIKEAPAGNGLSGASGGTVFLHVQPGKLPLTGPMDRAPSELSGADPELRDELVASGVERVRCLWPETRPHPTVAIQPDGSSEPLFDFSRVYALHFADSAAAMSATTRLKRLGSVTDARFISAGFAGRGLYCQEPGVPICETMSEFLPYSDPNFQPDVDIGQRQQWYINHVAFIGTCNEDIQSTCAWTNPSARGSPDVIVGLIDSGIDAAHPDLAHAFQGPPYGQRILSGLNFAPHADTNITINPTDVSDQFGHGTNVAGLLAAITQNGGSYTDPETGEVEGMAGVVGGSAADHQDAVGVRILPVRVLDHNNFFANIGWVISAIDYAAVNGARIINLSFGQYFGGTPENLPHELRDALYNAMLLGSTCVAAVGNDNHNETDPVFPAVFAKWGLCVAVGASNENGDRVNISAGEGSDLADFLDIVAPGRYMFTTQPTYVSKNTLQDPYWGPEIYYSVRQFGTSYACALASGVAASLLSVEPDLRDVDIKYILRASAANPNFEIVPNYGIGYGRLDHDAAVRLVDPNLGRVIIGETLTAPDSIVDVGPLTYGLELLGVEEDFGLPNGQYAAHEYRVWFSTQFPVSFVGATPLVWVKVVGTEGWAAPDSRSFEPFTHYFNYGGGEVAGTSTAGAKFFTTVYWLTQEQMWVPCSPTEARLRYGAVGTGSGTVDAPPQSPGTSGLELALQRNPNRIGHAVLFEIVGARGSVITVGIHDVRGRLIAKLEEMPDSEGRARFVWNGRDQIGASVPPGVYLLRAEQHGHWAKGRMVMVP